RFSLASLLATSIAEACAMQTTIQITRSSTSEEEDSLYQTSNDAGASILGVAQPSVSQPLHSHSQSMPRIPSQPLRSPSQPIPRIPSQPLRSPSQPIPRIPSQPLQSPSQPIPRLTPTTPAAATQPMHKITSQPLPTAGVTPPSINSGPMPSVRPMPTTTSAATRPNLPRVSGPLQVPTASSMPTAPFSIPASQAQQKSVSAPLPIPKLPRSVSRLRTLNFTDTPVYVVIGALVVLLIVLGTAIGASLALNKGQTASSNSLGHVFFQDDALGHADQLRIELLNPPAQPGGKSYFAWLQDTNQHTQPLGQLTINNGTASLLYQGDSKHTNLLSITQGILITVEDSGSQPQAPNGNKVFQTSFDTATLQALKDILYQTPDFPGNQGVAAGMVDTIKSMNDKAQSIVDSLNGHDYTLVTRQATRIIEMIDGTKYATSNGDLPAKYPRLLFTNAGLISSSTQTGYIDTLDKQLDNIKQVAGNNATLLQHIQNVKNAIADLRDWIQKIRTYDVQILKAADLKSPAILGTALQLSKAAADSYTGRTIPPNQGPTLNAGSAGAYQAYTECQYLATLDIQAA
ncbi:MAG TPA: hypothetical protein VFB12_10075, partial [Ktedonobacteraceae bacterium]|nr:hypothetical protein [Ktedonobacteraceae bacterium]